MMRCNSKSHWTVSSCTFFYSLEVLDDDKCFVVVYFELTKIGIVLPFHFFTFDLLLLYLYIFLYCIVLLVLCVMSYCDTVVCVSCLCLSLVLILVILWHVSYPAADGLILDWWNVNEMYVCMYVYIGKIPILLFLWLKLEYIQRMLIECTRIAQSLAVKIFLNSIKWTFQKKPFWSWFEFPYIIR
jgi:hypothetical protein